MATRGTAFLLLKERVLETTEFNGDMYPSWHGDNFFKGVNESENEKDFVDFIKEFNDENFGYEEDLIYATRNSEFYDDIKDDVLVINFNNAYFERFFSDWIFFKNLSGKAVKFIVKGDRREILIPNEGSYRFYFGRVEEEISKFKEGDKVIGTFGLTKGMEFEIVKVLKDGWYSCQRIDEKDDKYYSQNDRTIKKLE